MQNTMKGEQKEVAFQSQMYVVCRVGKIKSVFEIFIQPFY